MNRDEMIARIRAHPNPWDIVVIGGGATGAGVAVDAATRGYDTLLVEAEDFGKGTSSRSTKLVHGGVRYLEQGNVALVMEALKERGILRRNAPHLVHDLAFVVPNYAWWEAPFYGIGLKIYDLLAGKYGFGASHHLSREETLRRLPNIARAGLRGGVVYHDGQFDDARLLVHLVATAADHGATLANYMAAVELTKGADGFVCGIVAEDRESGERFAVKARVVINAAGIFADRVRRLAEPAAKAIISPSQGIHLVLDRSFLTGDSAILVPHTADGRVMFAIPWLGHTLIGTTDTPVEGPEYEPRPLESEIAFLLETAATYLARKPARGDILSVYTGIRPLVKAGHDGDRTASLSRGHTVQIDESGVLTIVGGKWTTYRHMAEDAVDHAATLGRLKDSRCVTQTLHVHGYLEDADGLGPLSVYGTDAAAIRALSDAVPALARRLSPDLPIIAAEIVWAARHEMARTVEDVLARRTRALFLNTNAALAMAPEAARLMAGELGRDEKWIRDQVERFTALAAGYRVPMV